MKRFVTGLIMLFLFVVPALAGDPTIKPGETLNLEQCLAIAEANHPELRAGQARTDASGAVIRQNQAALKPSLDASSGFRNSDGDNTTSASVTVSQLLSDGGKTRSAVEAAKFSRDSTAQALYRTEQTVAYDVKEAYFGLLQARWDYDVARETVDVYQEQLDKARAGYEAGTVARSDVTAAEVDLGQARLERTRARSAVEVARATLLNTMGILDAPDDFSIQDMREHSAFSLPFQEAFDRAKSSRPDLKAQELTLRAEKLNVQYQAKGLSPTLSAYGGYDWADGSSSDTDEWEAGLTLSIPLYDGGLTSAKVDEARAKVAGTQADYESLVQEVALEVRTALLNIDEAWENIGTTELTVAQAKENLDLATGRYRVGVGNSLEVSQAAEDYSQAKKDSNQALYDYKLALARLEKAMGADLTGKTGQTREAE